MTKRITVLSLISLFLLISCKKDDYQGETADFEISKYYKPFLFVKSDTAVLMKTLNYDFNDYAVEQKAFAKIKWVDQNQKNIENKNIRFWVNGKQLNTNEFKISSNADKGKLKLGIQILPDFPAGYISGFLMISNHELDVVNNLDLSTSSEERLFKWEATHKIVMNPVVKGLMWAGIIILALLVIWFLVLKAIVYNQFGKGSLTIQSPYFKNIRLSKATSLTLCNQVKKQNWREKLFKGKEIHYTNPLFSAPIKFSPHSKNKIRMQLHPVYSIVPFTTTLEKGVGQYTITNIQTKEKISITYG